MAMVIAVVKRIQVTSHFFIQFEKGLTTTVRKAN